ncbi:CoA-binding protein [Edaphobacter dinghuensis]|uniref:CoA-binding protein n=1 Tax=Edaphobacter dinghuensis TaxID=1560005 RepID=A0A917HIA4_9BACT|nr:CoA-binding protein [Edaphobacter dinghuensis]GGG80121.1 CoA-binding protein [Edaphobacter dinghuensis]
MNEPSLIHALLSQPCTIAVVGLSADPGKPSHYVPAYMQQHGYRILPVNPVVDTVLGETSYPTLTALPVKPDIVNVFRLPKFIPAIVEEMIQLGLPNLWVQSGIINHEAAAKAETAGIRVVMDRCIMVEHRRTTL